MSPTSGDLSGLAQLEISFPTSYSLLHGGQESTARATFPKMTAGTKIPAPKEILAAEGSVDKQAPNTPHGSPLLEIHVMHSHIGCPQK